MDKENNISIKYENCFGCGACVCECPKSAIKMQENRRGFVYPTVNMELCINCGRCLRVCTAGENTFEESKKETFAAISKSGSISKSSSGGVFAALAEAVLNDNGVVAGCAEYGKDGKRVISHVVIDKVTDLEAMQGSKYVQSNTTEVFPKVKERLQNGKKVLFSGTPCQVAALRKYLGSEYSNLYTIDLICHGVPSQRMYSDYLAYVEKKNKKTIKNFVFRDKSQGFGLFGCITFQKGDKEEKKKFKAENSSFYELFLEGKTYRESCYHCPFACTKRSGDITIGDFWGFEKNDCFQERKIEFKKNGLSIVVTNNARGKEILDIHGNAIELIPAEFDAAAKNNPRLLSSTSRPKEFDKVMHLYDEGYEKLDKWYQYRHFYWSVRIAISKRIPTSIKKKLGR